MPGLDDFLGAGTPTVSADDLVTRLRRILEDNPWQDSLGGDYAPGDGELTVNVPGQWAEGNVAEVDDGTYSQFRVLAPDTEDWWKSNPIAITPGYNSTADVAHEAGSGLLKGPRFPGYVLKEAIDSTIAEASSWAWSVKQYSLTPSTTTALYPMPSDFLGLIRLGVSQQTTASVPDARFYDEWAGAVAVRRHLPVTLAATGVALRFAGFDNLTNPVTVNYRAKVTSSEVPDNDIAEAIVFGAAMRVAGGKEFPLGGQDQGVADPSAVLHPGDLIRIAEWSRLQFNHKKAVIRAELRRQFRPAKEYVS